MEHLHESDQRTSSEDVEHLCESTIELIKNLNQQLAAAKLRAATMAVGAHDGSKPAAVHNQTKQPVICNISNASNRYAGTGDSVVVLTSPSEIPLTLRLDSWLGSDGRLVVKPSLVQDEHQEEKEDDRDQHQQKGGLEFGTLGSNANSSCPQQQQQQQSHKQQQTRTCSGCCYCEAAVGCATDHGDEGCDLQAQQQPQPPQQPKPRLQRQTRIFLSTAGASNSSNGAAAGTSGGSGRSLQPRRSLRLVPAATTRASGAGGGTEKETQALIRKLHRLLSLELKRSASRSRGAQ